MSGIYIHIPFCKSRCIYCGFYSTTSPSMQDSYTEAICKELKNRVNYIEDKISTIYLGGGTPSLLTQRNAELIFDTIYKHYAVCGDNGEQPEITMECNPDDVDNNFAKLIEKLPVNRISMGAQTFDTQRLKFLRRRHTADQPQKAVDTLRQIGIDNISIDLMFGFPNETVGQLSEDIRTAIALKPEHISAYSLMYEEGTPLYNMLEKGRIEECDENTCAEMYETLVGILSQSGYEHYEISNFAKPGFRSKHNSNYWKSIPYLGIGAAAHSYDGVSRQWNPESIQAYIEGLRNDTLMPEKEILTKEMMFDDTVMTRLRTCEGIDLSDIEKAFGKESLDYLLREAERNIRSGLLTVSGNHMRLSRKGVFVSDAIMSDLMMC